MLEEYVVPMAKSSKSYFGCSCLLLFVLGVDVVSDVGAGKSTCTLVDTKQPDRSITSKVLSKTG